MVNDITIGNYFAIYFKIFNFMKTLELNQMEKLQGGNDANDNLSLGVGIACGAIGVVALAGTIFTFGGSLAFGITLAGAMCTGAGVALTTAPYVLGDDF